MKMGFGGKIMKTMKKINSCIFSITGYADLPKEGEIIEIDVTLVSPSQQFRE